VGPESACQTAQQRAEALSTPEWVVSLTTSKVEGLICECAELRPEPCLLSPLRIPECCTTGGPAAAAAPRCRGARLTGCAFVCQIGWMRRRIVARGVFVIGGGASAAFAQVERGPADPAAQVSRASIAATAVAGVRFGTYCPPTISDSVGCPEGAMLAGVRLAPRWRFGDAWAVGVYGELSTPLEVGDAQQTWWSGGIVARYWAGPLAPAQFWLEASAGAMASVDSMRGGTNAAGSVVPGQRYVTWAPAGTLGVGHDWQLAEHVGATVELRASQILFDRHGPNALWLGPHTVVTFGLGVVGLGFAG
jgi:hypothetical protein